MEGLLFLVGWSVTDLELADERVSDPVSTWKVVAGETSKETSNAGASLVPWAPPRDAACSPSASDELPAGPLCVQGHSSIQAL